MGLVKFDLHCHSSEGSTDARFSILDHCRVLKEHGFGGLLITDHDSYQGYEAYRLAGAKDNDFVVLRGIEYDTLEYGHFIVVLPNTVPQELYDLLEYRGLPLSRLIKLVHAFGGILGPAHPFGEVFLSFAQTKPWKKREKKYFMEQFDFVEGYNACESEEDNLRARQLAHYFKLPLIAGTDAHAEDYLGKACTYLPEWIRTEEDFIAYYKEGNCPKVWGRRYGHTTKDRIGFFNIYLVMGFYFYNKFGALWNYWKRKKLYGIVVKELRRSAGRAK